MRHNLTLFTHQMCHSKIEGPSLVKEALQGIGGILFVEKDIVFDVQEAKALGVQMSPTLTLDGELLCVGLPGKDEIRRLIQERVGQ